MIKNCNSPFWDRQSDRHPETSAGNKVTKASRDWFNTPVRFSPIV